MIGVRFVSCALACGMAALGGPFAPSMAAVKGHWIVDPVSRCGTTSSFSKPNENIRWYGECRDGKLHGKGVLVWYNGQIETERNDGLFRQGEFHGDVLTTFPDGRAIYGQYWTGVRHGYFLVVLQDGSTLRATYEKGRLISRREISAAEARDWRLNWQQRTAARQTASQPQYASQPSQIATPQPNSGIASQSGAPRPTPAAPEPEARGFWSRINPLNWGIVEFVSGLFGGDSDDTVAVTTSAAPRSRSAVSAPKPAAGMPQPKWVAPSVERLPSLQPAAGPNSSPTYGTNYDMDLLLREPHPFAGRDGAFLNLPAPLVATGYQPSPLAAARQASTSWRAAPLASRAASQSYATPSVLKAQAADNLFLQGYGLESAGDLGGASAVYQHVVTRFADTRAAGLAGARLKLVRQTIAGGVRPPGPSQPVQIIPGARALAAGPPATGNGAQIVAANTPFPQAAAASSIGDSRALSMFTNSPWLQQDVCTRKGIYGGETRWCGRVLRDDGSHLLVEVQNIRLFGFGTIGISRSTCTGGTLLTWFSRGTTIRVPKKCLTAG